MPCSTSLTRPFFCRSFSITTAVMLFDCFTSLSLSLSLSHTHTHTHAHTTAWLYALYTPCWSRSSPVCMRIQMPCSTSLTRPFFCRSFSITTAVMLSDCFTTLFLHSQACIGVVLKDHQEEMTERKKGRRKKERKKEGGRKEGRKEGKKEE